jgi:hypothetical protein
LSTQNPETICLYTMHAVLSAPRFAKRTVNVWTVYKKNESSHSFAIRYINVILPSPRALSLYLFSIIESQ